jgi:plastocyanin
MRKTSISLIQFTLLLLAVMMSGSLMAQVDTAKWTGAVSSDASLLANWEPQQAIDGKLVLIDSAYKFSHMPVFSGSDSIEVNSLVIHPTGEMTIDFDDSIDLFNVATEYFEPHGIININRGTLQGRRVHIEDTNTVINVNSGGLMVVRKYLFMSGDGNNRPTAGYLNISGTGKVIYNDAEGGHSFNRFPTDTTTGVVTINPMGTLDLKGNFLSYCNTLIAKGQLKAGPGYDVVVKFDEAAAWTYVSVRDKMAFVIEPVANQFIITGEAGSKIGMVQNDGYAATSTFQWKYSTTSGSGYVAFSPDVTTDSIEAVFDTPGKYYVVCIGDGTKTSNEVVFFVGSDKVQINPAGQQFLRPSKDGAMLTVTKDAIITSVEWKWSATPGEGHVSFSPAATGDEFTPNFDTEGLYYIICVGKDASNNTYPSKDVKIFVDQQQYSIYWRGTAGNSGVKPENWEPLALVDNNLVHVGPHDAYQDSCVFSGGNGNIYVGRIWTDDSLSTMTVDMGTDTFRVASGSTYGIQGQVIVNSGVLSYTDLRHAAGSGRCTGRIIVKGTGEFLLRSSYFMMGNSNTPARGGYIDIMDDGKFISLANQPARFMISDTTQSVITISGNGMLQVPGNWISGAATVMATNQLRTPDPDLEKIVVTWPVVLSPGDTVTQVTAKSLLIFEVEPLDDQLVAVGEPVATLSTLNDADWTTFEWKYATASGGPYMAFAPASTGKTFSGSFDAAGEYYVICEAYGADTVMSSEVMVQAVSVSIAPTDDQNIKEAEAGTALTVTESITATSREWKSSTTSGSGYTSIIPPATLASWTPLFLTEGTYYVVCASTFGSKTINSNEVTIVVVPTAVEENMVNTISLYPNPAREAFYINAGNYNSFNLKVSDLTGRTILEREFENVSGPQKIELGRKGVYFVSISTTDGTQTVKMIMK